MFTRDSKARTGRVTLPVVLTSVAMSVLAALGIVALRPVPVRAHRRRSY